MMWYDMIWSLFAKVFSFLHIWDSVFLTFSSLHCVVLLVRELYTSTRHCWIYWILWTLFLLINLPSMFFKFSTLSCLTFKAQLEKPFLVHIKGGLVERFFVYNDEANFVSNIRRSFLSQIQLDLSRYSQFWIPNTQNPEPPKNWMFYCPVFSSYPKES